MKRFWISYCATIILLSVLLGIVVLITHPFSKTQSIHLPLPSSLALTYNNQVFTLNLWMPRTNSVKKSAEKKPVIHAEAALMYDLTTGETLYARNHEEKLPMASLTKVMTAVIALENKKTSDTYVVSAQDLVGEDSMGLTAGETLTLEELLYGLMLNSGNDAAEVLASNFPLGRAAFIQAMNNKAKSLGLITTHFTNPSGLQGDGDQYTTAHDLLVITTYALRSFPELKHIAKTTNFVIPYSQNHKAFYLFNETNLLSTYPGVKGFKTGYTPEAGLCLITYLDYEGHEIIGILLGSNNRRIEMQELLDYSLKTVGVIPPKRK